MAAANDEVCELCGCDACPAGFQVGNPAGLIEITPSLWDSLGSIPVPPNALNPEESTLAATLAGLGFGVGAILPCSLLDTALTSGLIQICPDELRLMPDLRETCGCPDVESGTPQPTEEDDTTCTSKCDVTCVSCGFQNVVLCWLMRVVLILPLYTAPRCLLEILGI